MNFLIANGAVIVPTYETAWRQNYRDPGAWRRSSPIVRDHRRCPSTALLTGGGSFHCISQQVPA